MNVSNLPFVFIIGMFLISGLSWIKSILNDWHARVLREKELQIEKLEAELELEQARQHTLKEVPRYTRSDEE